MCFQVRLSCPFLKLVRPTDEVNTGVFSRCDYISEPIRLQEEPSGTEMPSVS